MEVHDRSSSAAYSSHGSCVGKKKWAVVSTAKHGHSESKTSFYRTIQETLDTGDWCILLVGDINQDSNTDFSLLSHNR